MKQPLHFTFFLLFLLFFSQMSYSQVTKEQGQLSKIENRLEPSLSIIPNPSNGLFKVHWSSKDGIKELKVVNALGKQITAISAFDIVEYQFDLTNQPEGLYFLKIVSDQEETLTKLYLRKN